MNRLLLNKQAKLLQNQSNVIPSEVKKALEFTIFKQRKSIKPQRLANLESKNSNRKTKKAQELKSELSIFTGVKCTNNNTFKVLLFKIIKSCSLNEKSPLKTEKESTIKNGEKGSFSIEESKVFDINSFDSFSKFVRKTTRKIKRNNTTHFKLMPFNFSRIRNFSTLKNKNSLKFEIGVKLGDPVNKIDKSVVAKDDTNGSSNREMQLIDSRQKKISSKEEEKTRILRNRVKIVKGDSEKAMLSRCTRDEKKNFKILRQVLSEEEFMKIAKEYENKSTKQKEIACKHENTKVKIGENNHNSSKQHFLETITAVRNSPKHYDPTKKKSGSISYSLSPHTAYDRKPRISDLEYTNQCSTELENVWRTK